MKNIDNRIRNLSKQVTSWSNGGFNGYTLDNLRNYEVEREVEEEQGVVK